MGRMDSIELPPGANTAASLDAAAGHFDAGRLDAAESHCREILKQDPRNSEALKYLGLIATKTGHAAAAAKILARAVSIDGANAEFLFHLANAQFAGGAARQAAAAYRRAIQVSPAVFAAHVNLANTLLHLGDLAAAEAAANQALALQPANPEALSNLGLILTRTFRLTPAIDNLTRALGRARVKPQALTNLGAALQASGDNGGAIDCFRQALDMHPDCHLAERNLLIAMLNQPDLTGAERFAAYQRPGARHRKPAASRVRFGNRKRSEERRLKIGYVSSDFHDHPVGRNLLPLILNHDPAEFEIFLYAEEEPHDAVSSAFRARADHWFSPAGIGDSQLAARMRRDGIDVGVFLAGGFNRNRPRVAAYRTAPVQISFHDAATSGLAEMDYWLTDPLLHPEDTAELFTEQLYRLPEFYQFTLPGEAPEPAPPPFARNGFVTFGCFNKPEKINDRVFALWAEILHRTPAARLALKYRNIYADAGIRGRWHRRFGAAGLEPDRLQLLSGDDGLAEHLGVYGGIDIALDPFPYNGATTTFEALLAGVPVVALWGGTFVSRVAATLLSQIGAGDLAACSHQAYLEIACSLAGDAARLTKMRRRLGAQLRASNLCAPAPMPGMSKPPTVICGGNGAGRRADGRRSFFEWRKRRDFHKLRSKLRARKYPGNKPIQGAHRAKCLN